MNFFTEMERWHTYWRTVTDSDDCERQLRRLHWLSDFAFSAGQAISPEEFRALQRQIEQGERKITELNGEPVTEAAAPHKQAFLGKQDEVECVLKARWRPL